MEKRIIQFDDINSLDIYKNIYIVYHAGKTILKFIKDNNDIYFLDIKKEDEKDILTAYKNIFINENNTTNFIKFIKDKNEQKNFKTKNTLNQTNIIIIPDEILEKKETEDNVITQKEYESFCMDAIKGKELSAEDYEKMYEFDKYHFETDNTLIDKTTLNENTIEEKTVKLNNQKIKKKKKINIIVILIIIIFIIYIIMMGIYIGSTLFKLINK